MKKTARVDCEAPEPPGGAGQRVGKIIIDDDALAGEPLGWSDQIGEREVSRAVSLERQRQPAHRAGHADAQARVAGAPRVGLAPRVENMSSRRGRRRGFAVVDGDGLVAGGHMHQHEAAAAEVSRTRQRHGEREPDRHGGVDRVAALPQDLDADPGRLRFLRGHHAVLGDERAAGAPCPTEEFARQPAACRAERLARERPAPRERGQA